MAFCNHLHNTIRNEFFDIQAMSHVIKEKTLALLTSCENLCGYGLETIVHHFLQ